MKSKVAGAVSKPMNSFNMWTKNFTLIEANEFLLVGCKVDTKNAYRPVQRAKNV